MMKKTKVDTEHQKFVREVRKYIAAYMFSEGCDCCRDTEEHDKAKEKLAALLKVPKYSDGSGYNFYKYMKKIK